MAFATRD